MSGLSATVQLSSVIPRNDILRCGIWALGFWRLSISIQLNHWWESILATPISLRHHRIVGDVSRWHRENTTSVYTVVWWWWRIDDIASSIERSTDCGASACQSRRLTRCAKTQGLHVVIQSQETLMVAIVILLLWWGCAKGRSVVVYNRPSFCF